jgi:hypothetical protein
MNGQAVRALGPGDYFGEIVPIDHPGAPIVRYKPI